MSVWIAETVSASAARQWLYGFWEFYRQYTHTATHAASAAALTIFGLLVFLDPLFAGVAIAAYVCPPLVLYALGVGLEGNSEATATEQSRTDSGPQADFTAGPQHNNRDTNADSDTDSDSDDGDSDSDSDDGDTDTDTDS